MNIEDRIREIVYRGEDRNHTLILEDSNNIRNILILEVTFLTASFLLITQSNLLEKINLTLEMAIFLYTISILFYSLLLKEKTENALSGNFLDVETQLSLFKDFEKYKAEHPGIVGKQLISKLNQTFSSGNFKKVREELFNRKYIDQGDNLIPKYVIKLEHGIRWTYLFALFGNYCFLFATGALMLAIIFYVTS